MKHSDLKQRIAPNETSACVPSRRLDPRHRRPARVCAGLLVLLLAATGCSVHYDVLLSNGDSFTAYSKPKPDGRGRLVFKDKEGEQVSVSELRVLEIRAK